MNRTGFLTLLLVVYSLTSQAHPSWGIVVDTQRNIYFADLLHNGMGSVWKLSPEGRLTLLLSDFHAHNVSLDAQGNLITAHGENNHTMVRYNLDGSIDTLFHVLNYKEFFGGNCTYSPQGEIIFGTDKYLWRINDRGKREKVSPHTFEWNQAVYADEDGSYYAPDIGNGNGRVIHIDPNGHAKTIASGLIDTTSHPYDPHADILLGITRGCDDHIYVAETAGKRILRILEDQNTEVFYTSEGDWFPTGIDFFSGDAYIMEYKMKGGFAGPRIIRIDESGQKTVLLDYDRYQEPEQPTHEDRGEVPNMGWLLWLLGGGSLGGFLLYIGQRLRFAQRKQHMTQEAG